MVYAHLHPLCRYKEVLSLPLSRLADPVARRSLFVFARAMELPSSASVARWRQAVVSRFSLDIMPVEAFAEVSGKSEVGLVTEARVLPHSGGQLLLRI